MGKIVESRGIVASVRSTVATGDSSGAERLLNSYQKENGITPEGLEALSWLARGCLAAQQFEKAADYAQTAHRLAVELLMSLDLESEPSLASALGTSIEVIAQSKDREGRRTEAVAFLKSELAEYGLTSIGTRIRKNINLLTLEGQPAPELEMLEWLGPKPPSLSELHGLPVLLFFWAHYCSDSRAQVPVLMRVREKFESSRLALTGPTRRYGYLDEHRHKPALPQQETAHIRTVFNRYYSPLEGMPVPISERNFDVYGVSTTPTLVIIDRQGLVALYHPGKMNFRDLSSHILRVLG